MPKKLPTEIVLGSVAKHQPIPVGGVDDRPSIDVDKNCGTYDQRIGQSPIALSANKAAKSHGATTTKPSNS